MWYCNVNNRMNDRPLHRNLLWSIAVLSNVLMYSGTIHWCLWRCGCHHTTTTTTTTTTPPTTTAAAAAATTTTAAATKYYYFYYLILLLLLLLLIIIITIKTIIFQGNVLQFELILKIGSIVCAYGGRQKNISRAPRWTGLVYCVSPSISNLQ
jgi:uncharacterized integral membrane protein